MRFPRPLFLVLLGALTLVPMRGASAQTDSSPSAEIAALPYVQEIRTFPEHPLDGDAVDILLRGEFPWPCGHVSGVDSLPNVVRLAPGRGCPDSVTITGWRWAIHLGRLRAGSYAVVIELRVVGDPAHPGDPISTYYDRFEFSVGRPEPPIPGPLPFVNSILVSPAHTVFPPDRPICPYDSLLVTVAGVFPNDCYSLKKIEVFRPREGMPIVNLLVDDGSCLDRLCVEIPTPWSASVTLPPFPTGHYLLPVQLGVANCESLPPDTLYQTRASFLVDSCPEFPPRPCLLGTWVHPGPTECDAYVGAGQTAQLVFAVGTPTPLAGLQGQLVLSPPGLRIARLAPTGVAEGMHLIWTPNERGASFVLLAERGAPIVPVPGGGATPVLKVGVVPATNAPPAERTYLSAGNLLGSDVEAHDVPECLFPTTDIRFAGAIICSERDCDHNGDGHVDVRDLVLLVHCLQPEIECRDPLFDCNGDGHFSIEDVICCARRILGRGICDDCPPDSTPHRPEPHVRLAFGRPLGDGDGVALPLRIEGTARLGAASFAIGYPDDRYDVAGVEFPGAPSEWLTLYEARDGRVKIGLIQLAPRTDGDASLDVLVRLALKPGQQPGGQATCTEGEFSGPDGVPLDITMETAPLALGGPVRIALSENRPNPFTGATLFTLTLDRAARGEVGVYDVTGRLVASLHHGALDAGVHEFAWSGRNDDGAEARSGIYFYRARVEGQAVSRRMVLLRGR